MKGVVAVLVSCLASSLALPWVPGSSLPNTNVANLNALRFPRQPSTSNVHYIWYLASLHPHRRLQPPCRGWRCPPPPPHHDPSCKRVKCPKYKVLKKYRGFEERLYEPAYWATISINGSVGMTETGGLYKRLAAYFGGANAKKQKMKRTAPVVITVERTSPKGKKPFKFMFTMGFYLALGAKAPKPTDKGIVVAAYKPSKVYARIFYGRPHGMRDYWRQLKILAKGIKSIKGSVYTNGFSTAGYQAPFRRFQRHEVILNEKPKKVEAYDYDVAGLFQ